MTALLIFGIISLILTVSFGVVITVLVSRALSSAFQTVDSISERNARHVDSLLDRLVAIDWEKFASLKAMEDPESGGFFPPGEEEGVEVKPPASDWGRLSRLRERSTLTADEEKLLAEDFPDEGTGAA